MKRYDTYKDSGVLWLEEIPSHWQGQRLKNAVSLITEKTTDSSIKKVALENIESATGKFIDTESVFDGDGVIFSTGDILLGKLRPYLAKVWLAEFSGQSIGDIYVLRPQKRQTAFFIKYLLLSNTYISTIDSSTYGAKMPRANWEFISNIPIYLPPLEEQEGIVAFLDEKTAEIDELVRQVEREIELLKEYKQAEIARVVTRGLNPNAPLKPSGISWIGDIPQHWNIEKVGQNFSERREKVSDKDYQALSVSKEGVTPQLETAVKTNNGDNRKKVCKGDFVVNSRSDRKGSCGFSNFDGSVSLINTVLIPRNNVNGRYYHYVFRSNDFIEEFYRLGRGIVADLWTTRFTEQRNIMIPVPPIEEQQEVVDYIDRKTTEIDRLVVELTYQVEYLKEYKQRLIADVVTGKINVQRN